MGQSCPARTSPSALSRLYCKGVSQVQKGTSRGVPGLWFCVTELTQSHLSSEAHLCLVSSGDAQQGCECGLASPESSRGLFRLNGGAPWAGLGFLCVRGSWGLPSHAPHPGWAVLCLLRLLFLSAHCGLPFCVSPRPLPPTPSNSAGAQEGLSNREVRVRE